MSAVKQPIASASSVPELRFEVQGASALRYAAVPTLAFALRVRAGAGQSVNSILLAVQVQIAARRRGYDPAEQERLLELFGTTERWGTTLRTLPWLRTTLVVPPFTDSTVVDLEVPCTYDLEVIAARYFAALEDGAVPLELLFSGSVFFTTPAGALQTVRLDWNHQAEYDLPVAVWRETMDGHFRDSAWLRVGQESFQRLCAYKARHAFASWEETIDSLLEPEAARGS